MERFLRKGSRMQGDIVIARAETVESIERCFPVMSQLRPHVAASEFVSRVQSQQAQGYRLAYLEAQSRVRAAAGYRFVESLAWGRHCYVDDLVTDESERSRGFGRMIFDWLVSRAREADCTQFHLDSGVHRFAAHRFYFKGGLVISSHHFSMTLGESDS